APKSAPPPGPRETRAGSRRRHRQKPGENNLPADVLKGSQLSHALLFVDGHEDRLASRLLRQKAFAASGAWSRTWTRAIRAKSWPHAPVRKAFSFSPIPVAKSRLPRARKCHRRAFPAVCHLFGPAAGFSKISTTARTFLYAETLGILTPAPQSVSTRPSLRLDCSAPSSSLA